MFYITVDCVLDVASLSAFPMRRIRFFVSMLGVCGFPGPSHSWLGGGSFLLRCGVLAILAVAHTGYDVIFLALLGFGDVDVCIAPVVGAANRFRARRGDVESR